MAEINSIEDFIALDERVERYKKIYYKLKGASEAIAQQAEIGIGNKFGKYYIGEDMGEYYTEITRGLYAVLTDTMAKVNRDFAQQINKHGETNSL
jgi:hypothetical protein